MSGHQAGRRRPPIRAARPMPARPLASIASEAGSGTAEKLISRLGCRLGSTEPLPRIIHLAAPRAARLIQAEPDESRPAIDQRLDEAGDIETKRQVQ